MSKRLGTLCRYRRAWQWQSNASPSDYIYQARWSWYWVSLQLFSLTDCWKRRSAGTAKRQGNLSKIMKRFQSARPGRQ